MKKVLILESNEGYREELSAYFTATGYEVEADDDGARGMELIKSFGPDVVVLGLLLKTQDGFAVLEELQGYAQKPAIIVTGMYSEEKIVSRIIGLGANYYLMKPIAAKTVGDRVRELLEEPKKEVRRGLIDERITNIFISIGVPPHIKGYQYLREGIKMAVEDPPIINNITKELYPKIGEKYQTSASKVERAIRHAIEVGWNRGRVDAINAIFGARVYIGTEKPTNSEFIALVADKLLLENMR